MNIFYNHLNDGLKVVLQDFEKSCIHLIPELTDSPIYKVATHQLYSNYWDKHIDKNLIIETVRKTLGNTKSLFKFSIFSIYSVFFEFLSGLFPRLASSRSPLRSSTKRKNILGNNSQKIPEQNLNRL